MLNHYFDAIGGEALIQLDNALDDPLVNPLVADPLKWTARSGDRTYIATIVDRLDGQVLQVFFDPLGSEPGEAVLNYANAPSDITTQSGRWLPVVSGFPLPPM